MRQSRRLVLLAFLTITLLGGRLAQADDRKGDHSNNRYPESSSCQLNSGGEHNKIKHVIYIHTVR